MLTYIHTVLYWEIQQQLSASSTHIRFLQKMQTSIPVCHVEDHVCFAVSRSQSYSITAPSSTLPDVHKHDKKSSVFGVELYTQTRLQAPLTFSLKFLVKLGQQKHRACSYAPTCFFSVVYIHAFCFFFQFPYHPWSVPIFGI